jgi:hypothetical protein
LLALNSGSNVIVSLLLSSRRVIRAC